jgi:hypothetical protein
VKLFVAGARQPFPLTEKEQDLLSSSAVSRAGRGKTAGQAKQIKIS